jgi:hypothetical protein
MTTDLKTLTCTVSLGFKISLVSRHLNRRGGRETLESGLPRKPVLDRLACTAGEFLSWKTLHLDKSDGGSVSVDIGLLDSRAWLLSRGSFCSSFPGWLSLSLAFVT